MTPGDRLLDEPFLRSLLKVAGAARMFFADEANRCALIGHHELPLTGVSARSADDDSWHLRWGQDFNVLLTLTCPLECEHCSVSSSPRRREHLAEESIERVIAVLDAFRKRWPSMRLVLTGGEPFLHRSALRILRAHLEPLDMPVMAETSGYWARTPRAAARHVDQHPWIGAYIISADAFHEPFVSPQVAANAWRAARAAEKEAQIRVIVSPDDRPEDAAVLAALRAEVPEDALIVEPLFSIGRAEWALSDREFEASPVVPPGRCPSEGPLVREDGVVHPCCGTLSRVKQHPLVLGHVDRHSERALLHAYDRLVVLHALRLWGLEPLVRHLRAIDPQIVPDTWIPGDVCAGCYAVLTHPGADDACRVLANDLRFRLAVAVMRALTAGEEGALRGLEREVGAA